MLFPTIHETDLHIEVVSQYATLARTKKRLTIYDVFDPPSDSLVSGLVDEPPPP